MEKPKKQRVKRNNFTLTKEAQEAINKVPAQSKSYIVSQAIINFLTK